MPPALSKLQTNEDGTVSVPLRNEDGKTYKRIILREPTMDELAAIHDMILDANDELPEVPLVTVASTIDERKVANDAADSRRRAVYSTEGPHGKVFVKIVEMLSDETPTRAQLPGWAQAPKACQVLLDHFTDPLGGGPDAAQGWT